MWISSATKIEYKKNESELFSMRLNLEKPRWESSWLPLTALAFLVAVKIGMLLAFGPTMQADSSDYIAYADAILDGSFRHVDLAGTAQPITLTRIIGFPAVIAAAKVVTGEYWAWAVILLQFAASVCATV